MAAARTVRAYIAHCTIANAIITLSIPLPNKANNTNATKIAGNDNCISTTRIKNASILPP